MSKHIQSQVRYMVQFDGNRPAADVANLLRAQGLEVERVLPLTRTVGGTGPVGLKARMSRIPGVTGIKEEGTFDLPPFNRNVPQ